MKSPMPRRAAIRRGGRLAVGFVALLAVPRASAGQSSDPDLQLLRKQCEQIKENLIDQRKQDEAQNTPALPALLARPGVPDRAVRAAEVASRSNSGLTAEILDTVNTALDMIDHARIPSEQADVKTKVNNALDNIRLLTMPRLEIKADLSQLRKSAEWSELGRRLSQEPAHHAAAKAFGEEDGGGVFLTDTADMPVDRKQVTRAEYDLDQQRFILHEKSGHRWFLPRMDPELVAVIVRCRYTEKTRRLIAVSLEIDPVNNGRIAASGPDHQKVLFGCPFLEKSRLGGILLDADDLVGRLWWGMSRVRGSDGKFELLTTRLGYHSLLQRTLDHPATQEIFSKVPFLQQKYGMRVWIQSDSVSFRRASSDRIELGRAGFTMFSETKRLDSPFRFRGSAVPNPGADVYVAEFNRDFDKFLDAPLRRDAGEVVRPLRNLVEPAYVAALITWIRGNGTQQPIPMDPSWAMSYPIADAKLPRQLPIPSFDEVQRAIRGPIVVYNEHGPSRIIDEAGRTLVVHYDGSGRIVETARLDRNGNEVPGSPIRRVRR